MTHFEAPNLKKKLDEKLRLIDKKWSHHSKTLCGIVRHWLTDPAKDANLIKDRVFVCDLILKNYQEMTSYLESQYKVYTNYKIPDKAPNSDVSQKEWNGTNQKIVRKPYGDSSGNKSSTARSSGQSYVPAGDITKRTKLSPKDDVVWLTVSYDEKETAKLYGARWSPDKKRWFFPNNIEFMPEELCRFTNNKANYLTNKSAFADMKPSNNSPFSHSVDVSSYYYSDRKPSASELCPESDLPF